MKRKQYFFYLFKKTKHVGTFAEDIPIQKLLLRFVFVFKLTTAILTITCKWK